MGKNEAKQCEHWACKRTDLHDGKHCIFHSQDIEGKEKEFEAAFWTEFDRQGKEEKIYDFSDFIFSEDISFEGKVFEKDASFMRTQFSGDADFPRAQFSRDASFMRAQFSGDAYFEYAQFSGETSFMRAQFSGKADFWYITLKNLDGLNLMDTYFYDVLGLFEYIEANRKKFKYPDKTEFLPNNVKLKLGEETLFNYPIITRKIQDDIYILSFKKRHSVLHFLWWLFADCGRSIARWALWSLFFALYFAGNFYLIDYAFPSAFNFNPAIQDRSVWSFIYYSVVTFTTLGFGDIIPTLVWVQRWVMAEVIAGYIMLGGLISILANKLARRS